MNFYPARALSPSFVFLYGLMLVVFLCLVAPRTAGFTPSLLAFIFAGVFWLQNKQPLKPRPKELFLMAGLVALSGLSAFWAPDFSFALERSGKTAFLVLPGLWFIAAARTLKPSDIPKNFILVLACLYIAAGSVIALEYCWDFKLYRLLVSPDETLVLVNKLNRSIVCLSLFYLPVLFAVTQSLEEKVKKRFAAAFITLSLLVPLFLTSSQTSQLSFLVGLIFFLGFPVRRKKVWIALATLLVCLSLSAPWIAKASLKALSGQQYMNGSLSLKASVPHRLEIWDFAATEALKSPVYGRGVEALRNLKSETQMPYVQSNHILHPHNTVLQIWVEFGVIGIILGNLLLLYILKQCWSAPEKTRALYLGTFMSSLCAAMTGYGLWQGWQLGLFFILIALATIAGKNTPSNDINLAFTKPHC